MSLREHYVGLIFPCGHLVPQSIKCALPLVAMQPFSDQAKVPRHLLF